MGRQQPATCLCCGLDESEIPDWLRSRMEHCGYSSLSDLAKKTGTSLEDIWTFLHPDEDDRAAWKLARFVAESCDLSLEDVIENWHVVVDWLSGLPDEDLERRETHAGSTCSVLLEVRRGLRELALAVAGRRPYTFSLSHKASGEHLFIDLTLQEEGASIQVRTADRDDTFGVSTGDILLILLVSHMTIWLNRCVLPLSSLPCFSSNHQAEHELVSLYRAANAFVTAPKLPYLVVAHAGADTYDMLSIYEYDQGWKITLSAQFLDTGSIGISAVAQHPNELPRKLEELLRLLLRKWLRDAVRNYASRQGEGRR